MAGNEKTCKVCGSHDFYASKTCKPCNRRRCSEYWRDPKHQAEHHVRQKRARDNLKRQLFVAYGNACACCGETTEEFLSLDHKHGGGHKHRQRRGSKIYADLRRQGFPKEDYQLMCMNCNFAFGRFGYCPHQRKQEIAA